MQYSYSKKMFTRRAKPIRINSFRLSEVLLYFYSLFLFPMVFLRIFYAWGSVVVKALRY